jgi:SAM-dependent MidA family methyltransferase
VDAGGSISFGDFMQHALYAPGLGYYTAGSRKFGEAGDFITEPEVSPLFGRIVGSQVASVLAALGGGDVLEFGAGSGRLAVDMLGRLAELDALPGNYFIVEVSPELQQRQARLLREQLPGHANRVRWLAGLPAGFSGVIVANEVLDALPVERFVRRETVQQLCVRNTEHGFEFVECAAPKVLSDAIVAIEDDLGERLPEGFLSEVSLGMPGWVASVVETLQEGVALLFDYGVGRRGFYAPDRAGGWLRCHFRHHAHDDPLILPGIQDITAWVDFTAVATAAHEAGAEIDGYTSQATFLLNSGLDRELEDMASHSPVDRVTLSGQVKLLTLPGEMGEHFKCIGLSKGDVPALAAFRTGDRTHTL